MKYVKGTFILVICKKIGVESIYTKTMDILIVIHDVKDSRLTPAF